MTIEEQIVAVLEADNELMALLTGGVYTYQEIGVEGFRRGAESPTSAAFDENGELLPSALVRESGVVPFGNVRNPAKGFMAQTQLVAIYLHEMRGHEVITPASERIYELLENRRLVSTYPMWFNAQTAAIPDSGPILNSTSITQDWMVVSMRSAS